MDRRQARKAKKQKERQQQVRARNHAAWTAQKQQERRERYPDIRIVQHGAGLNPQFLTALRKAIQQINLDDPGQFTFLERLYYQRVREDGVHAAEREFYAAVKQANAECPGSGDKGILQLSMNLGDRIYALIPEEIRRKWLPYVDCSIECKWQEIVVDCYSLESKRGAGGTIYHSRHKPTITWEGEQYVVGFSRHAIDAISERLKPERISYGSAGDLFSFFSKKIYFETLTLTNGQPAIGMVGPCYLPISQQYQLYVREVFGEENINWDGGLLYLRLGYCPVVFEDGFVKAKTFLCPGFSATPEYRLLSNCPTISRAERDRLRELSTSLKSIEILQRKHIDHIKWFHQHGIPQVMQIEAEVFHEPDFPRPLTHLRQFKPMMDRREEILFSDEPTGSAKQSKAKAAIQSAIHSALELP